MKKLTTFNKYYLYKLIKKIKNNYKFVVNSKIANEEDIFDDFEKFIENLYLDEKEEILEKIDDLISFHKNISEKNFFSNLDEIESKIMWILGFNKIDK